LQDGAAHVMAIGDIVEPVEAWRQYKFEQTGQKWDYVFRVLYYTWTPDISNQGFAEPIEIANRDATAGAISNQDLWVGPDGSAYVMYTERVVQNAMMRDKFFPGESIDTSLHLAVVKAGVIAERRELVAGGEGVQAGYARFHETPDGKLYAVAYIANSDPGDYLLQVYPKSDVAAPVKIPLATPFGAFCLAGVRGGSTPSNMIDIFGHSTGGGTLSYARVDLK